MLGNEAPLCATVSVNPPLLSAKRIEIEQEKNSRSRIFFLAMLFHSWYSKVAVEEIRRRWEARVGHAISGGRDNKR